ncbi:multidrug resistance-associated protein 4-like isoform X2 [Stylophora pistillata]|uniref:multidrug resistance-associated protein 4-like isoform X2 n=1 Tax=Stylophora pistillata TaxID=50429 RepID=UPI000C04F2A5|nr:multidrug resistance-associated protein 4-like isoform X2 [Stylophora pistillata]
MVKSSSLLLSYCYADRRQKKIRLARFLQKFFLSFGVSWRRISHDCALTRHVGSPICDKKKAVNYLRVMSQRSEIINPREGAGVASVIFFWWMNGLTSLGRKRPLTDEDLPPLLEDYKAELLVKKAENYWHDESKRSQSANKKPQLWKALSRIIPWESALKMILLRALWALSFSFLPVCLWLLLKTLNDGPNVDIKVACFYVALLAIVSMTKATSTQHYDYLTELWGLRLKVALIGLVYKKMLSLNRYSLEATCSGNTITLVSNDVQKIERSLNQLGMVFAAPMELSISLGILWYFIGWEALIGAAVFFVLVPFQILLARKAADLRKKAAAFTDERLMVMNEIIAGIRAVKMFAWEWNFVDVVREVHKKETAVIRKKGLIVSLLLVLFFTTLPIAALISVTALILKGTFLSSFTIFTLLLGLVTIKFAFCNSLSLSVYIVAEAKVALDRIQTFLGEKPPDFEMGKRFHNETQPRTGLLNIHDNYSKVVEKIERDSLSTNCNERDDFSKDNSPEFAGSSISTGPDNTNNDLRSEEPFLSISNAYCSWDHDCSNKTITLYDVTLNLRAGELLAITGPVGSGKSSVLSAILGELPLREGTISYHGKVAYVPQLSWIFSGSVRENILFGLPFDEEKFLYVVDVCGLSKDLSDFAKGDLTEIGQRGVSLSGGQKARVGLARAVYSDADIYLLDDPLSALDTEVGRKLSKSCIVGHLSGCIRILVTHQLQYLKDVDCIVVMKNGSINHQGTYMDLKEKGLLSDNLNLSGHFEERSEWILKSCGVERDGKNGNQTGSLVSNVERCEMQPQEDDLNSTSSVADVKLECDPSSQSKSPANIFDLQRVHGNQALDLKEGEEKKRAGTVTWRLYWEYFREGLSVPLIMLVAVVLIFAQVCLLAPNWWLAKVSEMSPTQQKALYTQAIHASLVAVSLVITTVSCFSFYFLLLRAAENLHNKMAMALVKAPVFFYDTNPAGRILNRFSKDVGTMDDVLPLRFLESLTVCLSSLLAFLVPAATNYWLVLALLAIFSIFVYYARYYLASSRELKRIEAIKCSPVYSHITETFHGLEIVHISNKNKAFLERLQRYQDENTQAFVMVVSCNRWLGIRLDLLSSVFAMTVAVAAILISENPVKTKLLMHAAMCLLTLLSLCWTRFDVCIGNSGPDAIWCANGHRSRKLDDLC